MTSILAAFALLPDRGGDTECGDLACSDLGALESRFVARRLRRGGRMTRMACIGASGCLAEYPRGASFGDGLGVFHGTALGNLRETREVVHQVVEEPDHLPSPIRFSCSMSNMSSFFVAHVTEARGPNLLVSQMEFSFEGALLAATHSLEVGECEHALVGATDGLLESRHDFIDVLEYAAEARLGEGSGWLLLGPDSPDAPGELVHVAMLPGSTGESTAWADRIADACRERARPDEPIRILPGPGISEVMRRALLNRLPGARMQTYLEHTGLYPTASAGGAATLFAKPRQAGLYGHVANSDAVQSSLILIRVRPDPTVTTNE